MSLQQENSLLHIFSERLNSLMERHGVKQLPLAQATGISQANISRFQNGKLVPRAEEMWKLAAFFHVPMEYFLTTDEEAKIKTGVELRMAEAFAVRGGGSEAEQQERFNQVAVEWFNLRKKILEALDGFAKTAGIPIGGDGKEPYPRHKNSK